MDALEVNVRAGREQVGVTSLTSQRVAVCLGLLIAILLLLYARVLRDLADLWWTRDDYMHGFLILPLSLFLVWTRRAALRRLAPQPAVPLGLAVMLSAGIVLLLGDAGDIVTLTGLSLIAMIAGIVLLLFGAAVLRAVAFPIAYLGFMIPVLDVVTQPLQWPSQLLTARMAAESLQLLGFAVLLDRQYIVLPWVTLEVAKVCSGVGYLVSVAAIGLPLAWLTLRKWWSWAALVGGGLIISVVANWVRVVLIAVLNSAGAPVLHGPFHVLQGMFVAWVGYAALFAVNSGLVKLERRSSAADAPRSLVKPPGRSAYTLKWYRSWSAAMVTLGVLAVCLFLYDRGPVALKSSFATFPAHLGGWHQSAADASLIFRVEEADDELLRTYRNNQGRTIHLYVAYLRSQRQGKEVVDYRTARLHEDAEAVKIEVAPARSILVNRGHLRDRQRSQRIFFWYEINGRVIADRYQGKLASVWQAISRGRTNGALVVVSQDTTGQTGGGMGAAEEAFIRDVVSALPSHLP
jgi:EpsI family protein